MSVVIFSFEDGLENVLRQIRTAEKKPYITALHGYPNTGKSKFAHDCRDLLYEHDRLIGVACMTGDRNHRFNRRYGQDFVFLEDMPEIDSAQQYALTLFGKKPDQHLLFLRTLAGYSEVALDHIAQPYDAIIVNPEARVK